MINTHWLSEPLLDKRAGEKDLCSQGLVTPECEVLLILCGFCFMNLF